jgi:hypothetical protein
MAYMESCEKVTKGQRILQVRAPTPFQQAQPLDPYHYLQLLRLASRCP